MVKRSLRISGVILIIGLIIVSLMISIKESLAADDDIASGTSESCTWVIDSQGVLTISPTNGTRGTLGTFTNEGYTTIKPPWNAYGDSVTKVVVNSGVFANNRSSFLFADLKNCLTMDITNLNTSRVLEASNMFSSCNSITALNLTNFDTSSMNNMSGMFYACYNLESLDLSNFNTSKVTNTEKMFDGCRNLTSLNLTNFDTSKIWNMTGMFSRMYKLS